MLSPTSNKDEELSLDTKQTGAKLSEFHFADDEQQRKQSAQETLGSPLSLSDDPHKAFGTSNTNSVTLSDQGSSPTGIVDALVDGSDATKKVVRPHQKRADSTTDQTSLSSNCSSIASIRQGQNSLIFERFVQDPLVDAQPIPNSVPRHFSSENFVPASLDTATGLITGSEPDEDMTIEKLEDMPQRRPSVVSLQAAFGNGGGRSSNLTRQFKNGGFSGRPSLSSHSTDGQVQTISSGNNTADTPPSPVMKHENKSTNSFFSYADMINQEDRESNLPIRRPSLSLSISSQRLGRSGSIASVSSNGCSNVAPQRRCPPRSPVFGGNCSCCSNSRRNSSTRLDLDSEPSSPNGQRKLQGLSRRGSNFARLAMTHSITSPTPDGNHNIDDIFDGKASNETS